MVERRHLEVECSLSASELNMHTAVGPVHIDHPHLACFDYQVVTEWVAPINGSFEEAVRYATMFAAGLFAGLAMQVGTAQNGNGGLQVENAAQAVARFRKSRAALS